MLKDLSGFQFPNGPQSKRKIRLDILAAKWYFINVETKKG
jgi:hypothetical protein